MHLTLSAHLGPCPKPQVTTADQTGFSLLWRPCPGLTHCHHAATATLELICLVPLLELGSKNCAEVEGGGCGLPDPGPTTTEDLMETEEAADLWVRQECPGDREVAQRALDVETSEWVQ